MKKIEYKPNRACLVSGAWADVINGVKRSQKHNREKVWIKLELTPDLLSLVKWMPPCIALAYEKGYLEMEAKPMDDGNIYLSLLVDTNMGDEDGFGVEPDDYLVGVASPSGTFIEPLHIR